MSASNQLENDLLNLIFNNTATTLDIGDSSGLQPAGTVGNLYVSLHTADPGESPANQAVNEATYTGYDRRPVARTAGGWTVSGNQVSNTAEIDFQACTGGTNTISHYAIGTGDVGSSEILFSGQLTSNLEVANGITPRFGVGQLIITVD
jgi:hypothetical protein